MRHNHGGLAMAVEQKYYGSGQPVERKFGWIDWITLLGIIGVVYGLIRLAWGAPSEIQGPSIILSPSALPWYAGFSITRMLLAYVLSLSFSLVYGFFAANNRSAEKVLLPVLDILQSIPILSFLPVVLLSFSRIFPERVATEMASVVLIFTSQAWNLTFSWYQSLTTIPKELREASMTFRFSGWLRFRILYLPFAAINLIWNSMMSWAGGWFFLMAAEIFTVGNRDFRLPGLGAYLQKAASEGNLVAIGYGLAVLIGLIVFLDQFVWRPMLAWAERFKLEMVSSDETQGSWLYEFISNSSLPVLIRRYLYGPVLDTIDKVSITRYLKKESRDQSSSRHISFFMILGVLLVAGVLTGAVWSTRTITVIPLEYWKTIGMGIGATFLRVFLALLIGMAWCLPVGVLVGMNPRLASWLQPIIQIAAAVPATALFPVVLLFLIGLPGGLDLSAILLMLMGTQWYILFNVISGACTIPQDLKHTASLLQLSFTGRWRYLILPSLFPYLITGAITASGGAWNASIVAEHVNFAGSSVQTIGIGAIIAEATSQGNYPLLLAATITLIVTVVTVNRLIWRRLYRYAEEYFRLE